MYIEMRASMIIISFECIAQYGSFKLMFCSLKNIGERSKNRTAQSHKNYIGVCYAYQRRNQNL